MAEDKKYNVIIIGSGPAGLTAALYAARAELGPLLLAGTVWGGQLMLTTDVGNYPGFVEDIQGPELMQRMLDQAKRYGTEVRMDDVTKVDFTTKPFKVWVGDDEYRADSVIIATGSSAKWLDLPSEEKLRGRGVSSCATCDGFFFKDKKIVVIGGGDTAMEEAIFLTKFATEVTVIHRRDKLRASKIMQTRARENPKIKFIWDSEIVEVLGKEKVEGVRIKNLKSGKESDLKVEGMFVAIGHIPNTKFLEGSGVKLDEKGYALVDEQTSSHIEGVFISGDVYDHVYRQAITAAGMGCMAAMDAERWLSEQGLVG